MIIIQTTTREGEYLGPIDWNYNFLSHFDIYNGSKEDQKAYCQIAVNKLKQLTNGLEWEATTDGGWPRCGWGRVLLVGMYDGWPYWRPVPSVLIQTTLGSSWHSFTMITDIRPKSYQNE